jgi:hypothetical protein
MIDALSGGILSSLEIATLVCQDGGFALAAAPPVWWTAFERTGAPLFGEPELREIFPFLEAFLPDARAIWAGPEPPAAPCSDIW